MDKHRTDQAKFLGIAVGIFFCYFYYGIMQEKVSKCFKPYICSTLFFEHILSPLVILRMPADVD